MPLLADYIVAMKTAHGIDRCIRIEQDAGLYGYPPEIVSVGLAAIDEGKDAHEAIANYIGEPDGVLA